MQILRLYGRVLSLLGSESKLAWILALANLALATAQFAEPVLLGRIIDTLTGAQARGDVPQWSRLAMLLAAWAGFRPFHHRMRNVDRSLCGPPRTPAAPCRLDQLF